MSTCSVDDASDGYGTHTAGGHAWCTDSATGGSQDAQSEDFKRVTTTITWSFKGATQPALVQTATFAANGAAIGPALSNLSITDPTGLSATEPTITSPSTTSVTFLGTSVGANDMKFSVDGVEQTTGVTNHGSGNWQFVWDISQLTDGVYTIGATAVDALGSRGPARTIQVKLARGVPVTPQNVTGSYNYVYVSGTRTLVAELGWDANPEGNVTGYEAMKGSTTVCSASLAISCIDLTPAASGTTTYTVKTNYNDASGAPGSVSTTYNMTAPSAIAPSYVKNIGQASCGSTSNAVTVPAGGVAAGHTVIVRLGLRGGTSGAVSATDSRGNTYTVDSDSVGSHTRTVILSAHVSTALTSGDTITVSHPSATAGVVASEFSGIASSSRVDSSGSGNGNSNAPSATLTTTTANDLLYGGFASQNMRNATEASGWTTDTHQMADCGGSSSQATNHGAYRTASTTGSYTYNPTITHSERWTAAVVAYRPSGATTLAARHPQWPEPHRERRRDERADLDGSERHASGRVLPHLPRRPGLHRQDRHRRRDRQQRHLDGHEHRRHFSHLPCDRCDGHTGRIRLHRAGDRMNRLREEGGFALTELLVGMVVMALVLAVSLTVFTSFSNQSRRVDSQSQAQNSARRTIDRMVVQLRSATAGNVTGGQPIEKAGANDLVFLVPTQSASLTDNARGVMHTRYCLDTSTSTNAVLWLQTAPYSTTASATPPSTTACPSSAWPNQERVADHLVNQLQSPAVSLFTARQTPRATSPTSRCAHSWTPTPPPIRERLTCRAASPFATSTTSRRRV